MKYFTNLLQMMVVILVLCSVSSCKKDKDNDPANSSAPLLSSITSYSDNGSLEGVETYQHDSQGRIIELSYDDDEYKVVFEYSPSLVTLKEYNEGQLELTTHITLNSKSLAISSTSDYEDATYTYDNNGYLSTSFTESYNSTFSETYTVSNQNYVTITSETNITSLGSSKVQKSNLIEKSALLKMIGKRTNTQNTLKSASVITAVPVTSSTNFEFYADKRNTIDYENMGIFFLGKQNINPIKKESETTYLGTGSATYIYEYDTEGKITKMIFEDGSYEVYSYVD